MNLHLLHDFKFAPRAIKEFEECYPNENVYIINKKNINNLELNDVYKEKIVWIDYTYRKDIDNIVNKYNGVSNLLVHCLDKQKSCFAQKMKKINPNLKIYWIYFGADLYSVLYYRKNYKLYDSNIENNKLYFFLRRVYYSFLELIKKDYFTNFLKICNFFCFWDKYEYELLNMFYKSNIKYKFFGYGDESSTKIFNIEKKSKLVLIGNSASLTNNHITLLKKIKEIDVGNSLNLMIPISYGNNSVRIKIREYLENNFKGRYNLIENYMQYDEYMSLILSASIALFGSRRQEGAGNILKLISNGTKVYLRDDNNMLKLLNDDLECVAFSFEKDFNKIEDVVMDFPPEIIEKNRNNCSLFYDRIIMSIKDIFA